MIIITTVVENENGKDIAIGLDVDGKNIFVFIVKFTHIYFQNS